MDPDWYDSAMDHWNREDARLCTVCAKPREQCTAIYRPPMPGDTGNGTWVHTRDYGTDVERFNAEHNHTSGCHLARTVGSDYTDCDTHHAYVKHGVPPLLRNI